MLKVEGYIKIKTAASEFRIDSFAEIDVSSTWSNLTDNCMIKIPRRFAFKNKAGDDVSFYGNSTYGNVDSLLSKGDQIEIYLGYSWLNKSNEVVNQVNNIFTGFITTITLGTILEIKAEDCMYLLKKSQLQSKYYDSVNIHQLINSSLVAQGLKLNRDKDTTLKPFVVENETVAQLLRRLRDEQKMYSFFRGKEMYLGFLKYPFNATTHPFNFATNIISESLEYQRTDDRQLGVLARSMNGGKRKLQAFVEYNGGNITRVLDKKPEFYGGEVRTIHVLEATSKQDLIDRATAELKRYNYDGFKGSFITFGLPFVRHGDNVSLTNDREPEKNGTYKVKAVNINFKPNSGIRQTITLDYKI